MREMIDTVGPGRYARYCCTYSIRFVAANKVRILVPAIVTINMTVTDEERADALGHITATLHRPLLASLPFQIMNSRLQLRYMLLAGNGAKFMIFLFQVFHLFDQIIDVQVLALNSVLVKLVLHPLPVDG
jgi:hypothetical protein